MIDEIMEIDKIEELAENMHIPNKKGTYLFLIDHTNLKDSIKKQEEVLNNKELRIKDFYSGLITLSKSVDKKR